MPGASAFIAACEAIGFPRHRDINDGAIEGVAPVQMNVRRGRRVSTAQAYLRPARRRPNLRVMTGVTAQCLLIEGGRAVGAVVRRDDGAMAEMRAHREVVVCAGAIATPKLLMLSGIGDGEALRALGRLVTLHRLCVGQNLQDHFTAASASARARPAR